MQSISKMKFVFTFFLFFLISACFCTVAVSQGKNSVRAYVIDSPRFELFAFCDIKTAFQDGTFGIHHYDTGISFGVKF